MNIYLIRHGESHPPDPNLTEKGRRQAALLGQRLVSHSIQRIYASPLDRARQTAQIANQFLKVEVQIRDNLREIDMGDCDTRGWEYVRVHYPGFHAGFRKPSI